MEFNQNWIFFQNENEQVTGTIAAFKQTKNGKDFIILEDISVGPVPDGFQAPENIFMNVNKYQRNQLEVGKRYTFRCTNAETRFFDILPVQHSDWDVHDEVQSEVHAEVSSEEGVLRDVVDFITAKYESKKKEAEQYKKLLEVLGGL
jgi:hypothetical protein